MHEENDYAGCQHSAELGMAAKFQFDVFLSHSAKDKAVVRDLAARLKQDGMHVWLDEGQIKPGDSIPASFESHRTAVCFGHLAHDGQAESCAIRTPCHERLKEMITDRSRRSRALVSD